MSSISLGLIGCGAAAKRYYVAALKKYKGSFEDVYFVDKNIQQAGMIRDEVGFGQVGSDYIDIVDKVQGVIIALPHLLHYSASLAFLKAGKHVLCEKPLAESAAQVEELLKASRVNHAKLVVNNTRRMFPTHREVKRLIENNEIGDIKSIEIIEGGVFGWASATGFYVDPKVSSRGVLFDLGPHDIDLICWWLGEKPVLVSCKDDSFGGPESVVRIEARASGADIRILLNRICDLDSRFRIVGTRGVVEGKPMDWNNLTITDSSGAKIKKYLKSQEKNFPQFVVPVVANFLKIIEGQEDPVISGQDVQHSIEFIDECYGKRDHLNLPDLNTIEKKPAKHDGVTLVTGASGFIGGRVLEMLHLSGRRSVRATIRQWSSAARLGRFPIDIVQMDLLKPQEIEQALEGVTEVIHCGKGPGKTNPEGTKNLLEAARKKGVRHIVHLSTAEVYGNVSGLIDEDSPLLFTGDEYNKTKIEAENVCWEFIKKGFPVTILRPSIVYGPFSKNWSIKFAGMFLKGEGRIYKEYGEGKCNLVYVDDLVNAIIAVLDNKDAAAGQAFNVCGPEVVTWNEYFERFNKAMGLPPLKIIDSSQAKFKTGFMEPIRKVGALVRDHFMGSAKKIAELSPLADKIMRMIEHKLKTTPRPGELDLYQKKAVFIGEKVKRSLQLKPLTDIDKGLEETVVWLKSHGIL